MNHFLKQVGPLLVATLATLHPSPEARAQTSRVAAAVSGETRVLAVFARFRDDSRVETGCRAGRGWPLTDDGIEPLPDYAQTLFASTPAPPFADSTATAYFFEQSYHSFILYADVYPDVVVSEHDADYYRRAAGRGYGYLAAEIIAAIDEDVDFSRYDTNPRDGIVDQIFIFLRKDDAGTFTGVADLAGADRVHGRPSSPIEVDGVRVDWSSSGSFIYNERPGHITSQSYMVRMVAHEFGHHIWNPRGIFGGHVRSIRGNDIPANDDNTIGYTLMAGRGGGTDGRGDLLISAPERDALGWLAPRILDPRADDVQSVELGDLYATGESVRIDLPAWRGPDRISIYLANRQRVGWFDQYRMDAPPNCTPYEMGFLRTTGLLAMLTEWRDNRFVLDVLPSDNTLQLAAENAPYSGDLFGPNGTSQLTPFTRPSTALPDGTPSWIAIDEIEMTGRVDSSMQFVFVPDFRGRAIIREDSWISADVGTVVINGDLHVTNGSTLVIETGARVKIGGSLVIDPGARAVANEGARVDSAGWAHFFFEETEL